MADKNDKIKTLYGLMQKEGFSDIGDESSFRDAMGDVSKREIVYNALKESGYTDIGDDFDTFNRGIWGEANLPSSTEKKQEGWSPTPMQKAAMMGEIQSGVDSTLERMQQSVDNTRRLVESRTEEGRNRRKAAEMRARIMGTPTKVLGLTPDITPSTEGDSGSPKGRSNPNSPVVHGVKFEDGVAKTEWMLPDGSLTTSLVDADKAEYGARQARLQYEFIKRMERNGLNPAKKGDVERQKQKDLLDNAERRTRARLAENEENLHDLYDSRSKRLDKDGEWRDDEGFWSNFVRIVGGAANRSVTANAPKPRQSMTAEDESIGTYMTENKVLTDAKKLLEARKLNKSYGFMGGFWNIGNNWRNMKMGGRHALSDADLYVGGIMALQKATQLMSIEEKLKQGTDLSDAEVSLVYSTMLWQDVRDNVETPHGYNAAQITVEMFPFMAQMVLNPASGLSRAMVTKFGKSGLRKIAIRKAAQGLTGEAAEKFAKKEMRKLAAKTAGVQVLGDVAEASVLANTLQAPGTAANAIERYQGNIVEDDKGNFSFDGSHNWGEAIYKAEASSIIDNYTETLGEHFGIMGNAIGKGLGKGLKAVGGGKVVDAVSDMIGKIGSNEWAKAIGEVEKRAHWNGTVGEILEEEAGIVLNSIFTGDNQISDLWDADQQIDIVLGVGLFGGFVSGLKTVGYPIGKSKAKGNLRKSNNIGSWRFGEEWSDIRDRIENAEEKDLGAVIRDLVRTHAKSNEQGKAIVEYGHALMNARGYEIASASSRSEGTVAPEQQDIEESFEHGEQLGEGEDTQAMNDAKLWMERYRGVLEGSLGADVVAEIDADPLAMMSRFSYDRTLHQTMSDYVNAKAVYDGMIQRVRDDVDGRIAQSDAMIDSRINRETGMIQPATMEGGDRKVYIVNGTVAMFEDGTGVDVKNSSESIIIRDAETEKVEFADPAQFHSVDEAIDAETEKEAARKQIIDEIAVTAANNIDGVLSFTPGDSYSILDAEGNQQPVSVLGQTADENGMPIEGYVDIQFPDGSIETVARADLQQWVDAASTRRVEQFDQERHAQRSAVADVPSPETAEVGTMPTPEEPKPSALSQIPTGQDGEPVYEQAEPDTAWDALVEQTEGDEEIAKSVIEQTISEKEEELKKLSKQKPKSGLSTSQKIQAEKDKKKAMDAIQQSIDHWKRMAGTRQRRQAEEDAIHNAEMRKRAEEARIQAEQERAEREEAERIDLGTPEEITAILSAEERDEYGKSLVLARDGTTTFGIIDSDSGLAEAPIRLSVGENSKDENGANHGYGLLHIEAGHGDQIRNAGYTSVEEFVEEVVKNYTDIREGAKIGNNQTYLLEVSDKHNNTLFVQLSKNGTYWNVNSAGIFKKKYSRRKPKVYSVPAVGDGKYTDTTEVNSGQSTGATAPAGNSSQTSEDKITKSSLNKEGDAEESSISERIAEAEGEVNTNPTDGQKKAGNYKKGHVQVGTFDVTIENPKGSKRSGTDANGKKWESTMTHTYGYIRGTKGVDGDHIDVYVSSDIDAWNGRKVFVVDQYNPDGTFDEHKVMLGFNDRDEAFEAYLSNYEAGWENGRRLDVTAVNLDDFEKWIESSKRKTKAFADYRDIRAYKDKKPQLSVEPEGFGDFGPVFTQFKGDARGAIRLLSELQDGEAIGALHHKDIGDIDLVWGVAGTAKSDGYGLAKLVKFHPEVIEHIQEILDDMHIVKRSRNRINLESDTHKAAVRLTWNDKKKKWLLTAFEKKETSESIGKTTDTDENPSDLQGDTALSQNSDVSNGKVNTYSANNKINKGERDFVDESADKQMEESAESMVDNLNKRIDALTALHSEMVDDINRLRGIASERLPHLKEAHENRHSILRDAKSGKKGDKLLRDTDKEIESVRAQYPEEAKEYDEMTGRLTGLLKQRDDLAAVNHNLMTARFNIERYGDFGYDSADVRSLLARADKILGRSQSDSEENRQRFSVGTQTESSEKQERRDNVTFSMADSVRDGFLSENEFVEAELGRCGEDFSDADSGEWDEDKERRYIVAYNRAIDGYSGYVSGLARDGSLQKLYDSGSVGDRIKIRQGVETAGLSLNDVIDTSKEKAESRRKREEAKKRRMAEVMEAIGIPSRESGARFMAGDPGASAGGTAVGAEVYEAARQLVADAIGAENVVEVSDAEAQAMLEDGGSVLLNAAKRRALETAVRSGDHQATVVSSAAGAKVLQNLDKLALDLEKSSESLDKSFIGYVSAALGLRNNGNKSNYGTFETKSGVELRVRVSDHNAHPGNFEDAGYMNGLSIVVSRKPNKGMEESGNAHLVEYYYNGYKLAKSDGKPLVRIVHSIKQALYSGEFVDTTGLAERQEVNADREIRLLRATGGAVYGWTVGGKVYLNRDAMNAETPVHEYTHLWDVMVRERNPELWKRGVELMKQTPVWDEVAGDSRYADIADDEDAMASEVHARLTGRDGAKMLDGMVDRAKGQGAMATAEAVTLKERIKGWLRDMFKALKETLGKWSRRELKGLTVEDFNRMTLRDLAEGMNPRHGDRTLAGVHNISEAKLLKALRVGGLVNPSVAVMDVTHGVHDGYGEISLVMPSEKIDRRMGRNAGTWAGDAWTPTYPMVERRMKGDGASVVARDIYRLPEEMQSLTRMAFDGWLDGRGNERLAYWYLHERGEAPETVRRERQYTVNEAARILRAVKRRDAFGDLERKPLEDLTDEERATVREAYITYRYGGDAGAYEESLSEKKSLWEGLVRDYPASSLKHRRAEMNLGVLESTGLAPAVSGWLDDVQRDMDLGNRKEPELTARKALDIVEERGLRGDFDKWVEGLTERYGIEEVIFDGFTPSGNRRYVKNSAENVSRIMRDQGRNAATGTGGSFAEFVATVIKSMGTRDEIRREKYRLRGDHDDTDAFDAKWSDIFFELGKKCQPDAENRFDDYGMARLTEAAGKRNPAEYLEREYGVRLEPLDVARLMAMIDAVKRERPAMYFETKFERPVQLNEFAAAVVPDGVDAKVESAMRDAGLRVVKYDPEVEGDRRRALIEATDDTDVRFHKGKRNKDVSADDASLTEEEDEVRYRLEDENERFNEQLERYKKGIMDKNEMLHIGLPQGVMRLFLPHLPIVMRQRILNKASIKKHNVDIAGLTDMPRHLSDPIFVFKRADDVLGVLTEMQDRDGKNVCVAIEMNRSIQDGGEVLEVNDIRSVHGRNVADIIYPIIQNGTLRWVDKKKGLNYLSSASRYVRQEIDGQDLENAAKVIKTFENPTIDDEESLNRDWDGTYPTLNWQLQN